MVGTIAYRQGDVVLKKINNLPGGLTLKDRVVAYGEVTGHKHLFEKGNVYTDGEQQYVVLEEPTLLLHEEHHKQLIPKGIYSVNIKREVNLLDEVKTVLD